MAEEFGRSFATLPMGQLICGPIIAVARDSLSCAGCIWTTYLSWRFGRATRKRGLTA